MEVSLIVSVIKKEAYTFVAIVVSGRINSLAPGRF